MKTNSPEPRKEKNKRLGENQFHVGFKRQIKKIAERNYLDVAVLRERV